MDSLIKSVQELKELSGYKGGLKQFRSSSDLVVFCRKNQLIADIKDPADICKNCSDDYYTHLTALTKKYLFENKDMKSWEKFASNPENRKAHKILHEFGVRGELFSEKSDDEYDPITPNATRITIEDLHEIYQIKFNYEGSLQTFKKQIWRMYGSYAEFCLEKGYDINNVRWEPDFATRVANKIGSKNAIQKRCPTLWKYLVENNLTKTLFKNEAA